MGAVAGRLQKSLWQLPEPLPSTKRTAAAAEGPFRSAAAPKSSVPGDAVVGRMPAGPVVAVCTAPPPSTNAHDAVQSRFGPEYPLKLNITVRFSR